MGEDLDAVAPSGIETLASSCKPEIQKDLYSSEMACGDSSDGTSHVLEKFQGPGTW